MPSVHIHTPSEIPLNCVGNAGKVLAVRTDETGVEFTTPGGASLPAGVIVMWSGLLSAIPAGWALCDGAGGRPNLLDKFVKGVATAATNPGATGGAATHTHASHAAHVFTQAVAHVFTQAAAHANHVFTQATGHSNHVFTQAATHTVVATKQGTAAGNVVTTATHTGSGVDAHSAHSGGAVDAHSAHSGAGVDAHSGAGVDAHSAHDSPDSRPPWYEIAYIIKT